jgi:hypothetical protein
VTHVNRAYAIAAVAALVVLASTEPVLAQNTVDGFVPRTFKDADGKALPYRLFIPGR